MKGGRNVFVSGKSLCYQIMLFVMEHELGGDRAVIIVSALVAILSSSTSVSKDNIGVPLQRQLVLHCTRSCYNC